MDWVQIVVLVLLGATAVYFIMDSVQALQAFRRRQNFYFLFGEDRSRQRARRLLEAKAESERRPNLRTVRDSTALLSEDDPLASANTPKQTAVKIEG